MGGNLTFSFEYKFFPTKYKIRRVPIVNSSTLFSDKIDVTFEREKKDKPFIIGTNKDLISTKFIGSFVISAATVAEIERRGKSEVGIYRLIF